MKADAFALDDDMRAAAEAWYYAMRRRKRTARMSPMDEMAWFQEPRVGEVLLGTATASPVQVVPADPMRVRLVLGVHNLISFVNAANTSYDFVAVSTQPTLINGCLQGGVMLSIGCCHFVVDDDRFPNMVQKAWYTFYYPSNVAVATGVLHFTEIRLRAWPKGC